MTKFVFNYLCYLKYLHIVIPVDITHISKVKFLFILQKKKKLK